MDVAVGDEEARMHAGRASADELAAAFRRFELVAARWALDPGQAAALLGVERRDGDAVADLAPVTVDAETRMRLVVEVDSLLGGLLEDEDGLVAWLREPHEAFVGCMPPLRAMSLGAYALRALRNVLADAGPGSRL